MHKVTDISIAGEATACAPGGAAPASAVQVLSAHDLTCVQGVNEGDSLTFAAELVPEDRYRPDPARRDGTGNLPTGLLQLCRDKTGALCVADGSERGRAGARLHLDCVLTFMTQDARTLELLLLVEVDGADHVTDIHVLPLTGPAPERVMTLVGIDTDQPERRFAELACLAFTRGTRITLASGEMRAVEHLRPGDRVLTRDAGPQVLRWIGEGAFRATGPLAPVAIPPGLLGNERELLVSPDHRLFLYQRNDRLGLGRREVMLRAAQLVDGSRVQQREGGYVDYFQLLFDSHQIIYAEGIATESLLLDARSRPAMPSEIAMLPEYPPVRQRAFELTTPLNPQDLLRQA